MLLASMVLIASSTLFAYDKAPPEKQQHEQVIKSDQTPLFHKDELKAYYSDEKMSGVIYEEDKVTLEAWGQPIVIEFNSPPEQNYMLKLRGPLLLLLCTIVFLTMKYLPPEENQVSYPNLYKRE
jgi:hypothetical protein